MGGCPVDSEDHKRRLPFCPSEGPYICISVLQEKISRGGGGEGHGDFNAC